MLRFAQRFAKGLLEVVFIGPGWPWNRRLSRLIDRLTVAIEGGER